MLYLGRPGKKRTKELKKISRNSDFLLMKMKALGLHHKSEADSPSKDTVLISKDLPLYILCNGVGDGPGSARTAKETAHLFSYHVQEEKSFLMAFNEDPSNQKRDLVKKVLHEIIQKMNQKIYLQNQKHPPEKAIGTTLLFGLFIGSDVFLGNLGNGKVFLCRGEESFILMNGNSKWDVLLKSGKVTEKDKVGHPSHYEPHKYVGSHKDFTMDLFHMEMIEKDFLLLSTDALSNSIKPNDVLELTKKETDFKKLPKLFLNIGLSRNVKDDISFIVVKDSKHQEKLKPPKRKDSVTPIRKKKAVSQAKPLKKDQELPEQKVLALKGLPLFHELSYRELLNIIEIIELKVQKKGELVIKEHESGSKMFILLKGLVQVHKGGKKLARLQRGQWFGEMALIDDELRSASVTCLTPTAFVTIERGPLMKLIQKNPETGVKIFHAISKTLSQRLRKAS